MLGIDGKIDYIEKDTRTMEVENWLQLAGYRGEYLHNNNKGSSGKSLIFVVELGRRV